MAGGALCLGCARADWSDLVSTEDFQGAAHAFKRFMQMAAEDIQQQRAKGVTVKWAKANPAKTTIGGFKAKLLRMKQRA